MSAVTLEQATAEVSRLAALLDNSEQEINEDWRTTTRAYLSDPNKNHAPYTVYTEAWMREVGLVL